jgi:enoyl-CoA hydratase/carnithine racemase
MCGEVVDRARAVDWGVAQYAPEGDVMQFTLDMASKWAQKPELASHLAKKVIDFGIQSDKALLVERIAEAVLYQVTCPGEFKRTLLKPC